MAMGMSYHDYWHGDPEMVIAYREADAMKQEAVNVEAWLHGVYIYKAFSTVMDNAFRAKGTQPKDYLKEPFDISPPSRAEEILAAGRNRAQMVKRLNALAKQWEDKEG